jgi:hypothetical protein
MTTDAAAIDRSDPPPLYCYRHPDRETWVRCGRCDQPICMRCAMQGPVGLRCKVCGTPSRDPLTAMTFRQMALGGLIALGAGSVGGAFGIQAGFFLSICLGPIAGGLIAEAVMRVTGYKRGPRMLALVGGGIIGGALVGAAIYSLQFGRAFEAEPEAFVPLVSSLFLGGVVYVVAALIGAFSRFRW